MGVHDYVCFVQRNGQCVERFEPLLTFKEINLEKRNSLKDAKKADRFWIKAQVFKEYLPKYWKTDAESFHDFIDGDYDPVVVTLPGELTRDEILEMDLRLFKLYPNEVCEYSCDSWEFDKYTEYRDLLIGNIPNKENCSDEIYESVWRAKDGNWRVNFNPFCWDAFVTEKIKSKYIPYSCFNTILQNRGIDMDKKFPELDKAEIKNWICQHSR